MTTRFLQESYDKHIYHSVEVSFYNTIARFSSLGAFNRNFLNCSPLHDPCQGKDPTLRYYVVRLSLERTMFCFNRYCTASTDEARNLRS